MKSIERETLQRVAGVLEGISASGDITSDIAEKIIACIHRIDFMLKNEMKSVVEDGMNKEKQIEFERGEISEIIAQNFKVNDDQYDASDFEWSAHCVQVAGYRKTSEVAREIFEEIERIRLKEIHKCETLYERENEVLERKYWEGGYNSLRQLSYWIAELKKKYTEDGK